MSSVCLIDSFNFTIARAPVVRSDRSRSFKRAAGTRLATRHGESSENLTSDPGRGAPRGGLHPPAVGAHRPWVAMRDQTTALKLPIRSERATGALALLNHHRCRFCSLWDRFPPVLVGGIRGEYFFPMNLESRTQVQNPTHVRAAWDLPAGHAVRRGAWV